MGQSSNCSVLQQISLILLSNAMEDREARQVVLPSNGQNVSECLTKPCGLIVVIFIEHLLSIRLTNECYVIMKELLHFAP